jgi:hypothetical protein
VHATACWPHQRDRKIINKAEQGGNDVHVDVASQNKTKGGEGAQKNNKGSKKERQNFVFLM